MSQSKTLRWVKIFIAEVIGTSFLLIIGCLGCVDNFEYFKPSHITVSTGAGLALMIGINCFATISGAHFNPSVTLAALVCGMIDLVETILYLIAQIIGALFGYCVIRALISSDFIHDSESFCMNIPRIENTKAVVIEFIITFVLISVICAVWDPKNEKFQDSASIRIGMTVVILVFIAGNFSGGSMNPARSFGPAFYNSNWKHHWIYWVGPLSGSFAASILFRKVFMDIDIDSKKNETLTNFEELEQMKSI